MTMSKIKNSGKANFTLLFNKEKSIFKENRSLKIKEGKINFIKILIGKGEFYTHKGSEKILNQKEAFG